VSAGVRVKEGKNLDKEATFASFSDFHEKLSLLQSSPAKFAKAKLEQVFPS
jgi:hypothetical protein